MFLIFFEKSKKLFLKNNLLKKSIKLKRVIPKSSNLNPKF